MVVIAKIQENGERERERGGVGDGCGKHWFPVDKHFAGQPYSNNQCRIVGAPETNLQRIRHAHPFMHVKFTCMEDSVLMIAVTI